MTLSQALDTATFTDKRYLPGIVGFGGTAGAPKIARAFVEDGKLYLEKQTYKPVSTTVVESTQVQITGTVLKEGIADVVAELIAQCVDPNCDYSRASRTKTPVTDIFTSGFISTHELSAFDFVL